MQCELLAIPLHHHINNGSPSSTQLSVLTHWVQHKYCNRSQGGSTEIKHAPWCHGWFYSKPLLFRGQGSGWVLENFCKISILLYIIYCALYWIFGGTVKAVQMYSCLNVYLSKCMRFGWEQGLSLVPKCIICLNLYVYGFRVQYTYTEQWQQRRIQKIPSIQKGKLNPSPWQPSWQLS